MENKVTATILIPSYKRAELLRLGLWSLSQQGLDDSIEIIVLNDGFENDGTLDVVELFKSNYALNVRYIFTGQRNKNGVKWRVPGFAFNVGAKAAKGDILILSCPEIFSLNNTIDYILQPLLKDDKVISTVETVLDDTGVVREYLKSAVKREIPPDILAQLKDDAYAKYLATLPHLLGMHKKHYFNVGGYDEKLIGYACDDDDVIGRLNRHGLQHVRTEAKIIHLYHGKEIAPDKVRENPAYWYNYNIYIDNKNRGVIKVNEDIEWGALK